MQASGSDTELLDNYNEFDVLDEQIVVSVQQQSCSCNNWSIHNKSTALVDQSLWYLIFF